MPDSPHASEPDSDPDRKGGPAETIRGLLGGLMSGGGSQQARERAHALADEVVGAAGRLRGGGEDGAIEELRSLRAEVQRLSLRVDELEGRLVKAERGSGKGKESKSKSKPKAASTKDKAAAKGRSSAGRGGGSKTGSGSARVRSAKGTAVAGEPTATPDAVAPLPSAAGSATPPVVGEGAPSASTGRS